MGNISNLTFKHCVETTPSDSTEYPPFYVIATETAGAVTVLTEGGEKVQFNLEVNQTIPVSCIKIFDTDTDNITLCRLFND